MSTRSFDRSRRARTLILGGLLAALAACSSERAGTERALADQRRLCGTAPAPHSGATEAQALHARGLDWARQARLRSDPGFYLNAGACADLALALDPADVDAAELRGQVLMNLHDFAGARALAAALVERQPARASAYGLLADAQLELGEFEPALQSTQRQLSLHPDMGAHARASYLRWLAGDQAGARRLIKAALVDRDPKDPEAAAWTFVEAGNLFWHAGDLAGADAIYGEALRWLPDYPAALVGRARIALAQGDLARAVTDLQKSLRQKALVETAWLLGDALAVLGDAEAAAASYRQTENIGRRGDRLMLASFLVGKDRNAEEALRLLDAEARTRSNIYLDDTRAWALYRLGRHAEALVASDRALRLGTPDARLLFHAGAIRMALGDSVEGIKRLERALALNPHFDLAAVVQAQALLAQAQKQPTSKQSPEHGT